MSQQPSRIAAAAPRAAPPKHRRGSAFGPAATRGPRRALLLTAGVLVPVLLAVLGYALFAARDDTAEPSAGGPAPVPTGPPGPGAAPPAGDPAPPGGPAPPDGSDSAAPDAPAPSTPAPDRTTPPPDRTTAPPADRENPPADRDDPPADRTTPPRRDPRLVGPKSANGFEKLLSDFCRERDFRTAVLLEGGDGSRRTGDWVCVQTVSFTAINLNDACREEFGPQARARRIEPRDATTWRCFDS